MKKARAKGQVEVPEFGGHNHAFVFPISPCLPLDPFGVPVPSKEPFGPGTRLNVERRTQNRRRNGEPACVTDPVLSPGAPGSKDHSVPSSLIRGNFRRHASTAGLRPPGLAACRARGLVA